jgi:hypothetical protein
MSRRFWYFVVVLAFALHNLEEAIAASRMLDLMESRGPGYLRAFYSGIDVFTLRTSLLILTVLGLLVTVTAARSPTRPGSSYVMLVFGAIIGLNALAHVALTVALRAYMPGLLTALLLTLPVSALLLTLGRRERWVSSPAYWTILPVAVVVHGPVLLGFLRISIGVARSLSRGAA